MLATYKYRYQINGLLDIILSTKIGYFYNEDEDNERCSFQPYIDPLIYEGYCHFHFTWIESSSLVSSFTLLVDFGRGKKTPKGGAI